MKKLDFVVLAILLMAIYRIVYYVPSFTSNLILGLDFAALLVYFYARFIRTKKG